MSNNKPPPDPDDELFRAAMHDVAPLPPQCVDPYRRHRRPLPLQLPVGDEQDDEFADLNIETGDFLEFCRPGIQKRVFHDLQRGHIEPEASIDLHGMRVTDARPALARFLAHALRLGCRCVRVIHGKGRGSSGEPPVLKQKTNQWLRQHDAVLAFVSTPRWDGGSGAAYVLLSRKHR